MKKKSLILPFLAAMALAGCSDDNEPAPGNVPGSGDSNKNVGYVAVNIVQPSATGRADTGFESGTVEESTAESAAFWVFMGDNTLAGNAPQVFSLDKVGNDEPNVETVYKTVLVIDGAAGVTSGSGDGATTGAPSYAKIYCVLNPTGEMLAIKTEDDLKKTVSDYATGHTGKGTFIMTNSSYRDNDTDMCAAIVKPENICTSEVEAKKNPVDIYVERVVAKVTAHKGTETDGGWNNAGADVTVEGTDVHFDIDIKGIGVINVSNMSYLFKNITNVGTNLGDGWGWSAPDLFRSYWENTPYETTGFEYTTGTYNTFAFKDGANFDNFKFSTYIQPNTNTAENKQTAIAVTAQLLKKGTEEAADLVWMRGGFFYKDAALQLVADYINREGYVVWDTTTDKPKAFTAGNFEFAQVDGTYTYLKSYEVLPQIAESSNTITVKKREKTELIDAVNYKDSDIAAINTLLAGTSRETALYRASYYKDGMCYYYVNIDQSGAVAGTDAHKHDGVVRNHIYELALNSIKGLGVPVFNPDDPVIPVTPPTDPEFYYLSATVKVLAWKVVKQGVGFGDPI